MQKIYSDGRYDYYVATARFRDGKYGTLYNISLANTPAPLGGYVSREFVEDIFQTKFPESKESYHGTSF